MKSALIHRNCKRVLDAPVLHVYSAENCAGTHAGSFRPFSGCECFAIERKEAIVPFISVLSNHCCPANVVRLIISIVSHALNAPSFFTKPNIIQKIREGIVPLFTNFYAATVVVFVAWVRAALLHVAPSIVNSGSGVAVLYPNGVTQLSKQAATRLSVAASEIGFSSNNFISAVASASGKESWVSRFRNHNSSIGQNNKPSKSLSDDVYCSRHGVNSFMVERFVSGGIPALTGTHCDYQQSSAGVN